MNNTLAIYEPTLKEVWRVSSADDSRSMWYTRDGHFDPILSEVIKLPMPTDELRLHLGNKWLSGTDSPDLLELWFPGMLGKLGTIGFVTRKFMVRHWKELPSEIVFDSSTAIEVPIGD